MKQEVTELINQSYDREYISKASVVAEIERIKKEECPIDTYEGRNKLFYFERFLSFLNTLEVKEVDFGDEDGWKNTGGFGSTWDPDSPDYCPD